MIWKTFVRPALFCLPPESIHHVSMGIFSGAMKLPPLRALMRRGQVVDPRLQVKLLGLDFPNPVGLAAGFDKEASWFNALAALGFGSIEVGTLTRHAQPGNPSPRLFRLKKDHALVNRMGFNNHGCDAAAQRLSGKKIEPVLGINIGKSKITPLDESAEDYLYSFEKLYPFAAYFTVNVSSPNTPGLRELQNREPLQQLLQSLKRSNQELVELRRQAGERDAIAKPVLLKIAPDLTDGQLDDVISIISSGVVDGIIATNTTISREGLQTDPKELEQIGDGGLSGSPLTERSREYVRTIFRQTEGKVPIIGVGGIMNGDDAWNMMTAGASLVQIYTGFVYGGPSIVNQINRTLLQKLEESGKASISEVVGMQA